MTTTTCDRLVPLTGARNVRDLGGYPSQLGGTVRWGRLFRAGRLDGLTADDVAALRALDLAVVYDLRTDDERTEAPDAIPSVHVPMLAAGSLDEFAMADLGDRQAGVQFLIDMSMRMLDHAAPEIGAIMFSLADPDSVPMMFHCTAGKDRTGLLAALILELLDVPREAVLDDYELSTRYHRSSDVRDMLQRLADRGVHSEVAAGLLSAPRSVMSQVLTTLDDTYGGVERYLADRGGLDRGAAASIRAALLDD